MRRAAVIIVIAAFVLGAATLAGCNDSGQGQLTLPATKPTNGTTPAGPNVTVFLLKEEIVMPATRAVAEATPQAALTELLKGPTAEEAAQGLQTAVPSGTLLQGYTVTGNKATVDFSKEMLNYGGGSARVQAIIGQITNTVTANDPNVKSVVITVDGNPADEVLQP